jgi:hypothetical protein
MELDSAQSLIANRVQRDNLFVLAGYPLSRRRVLELEAVGSLLMLIVAASVPAIALEYLRCHRREPICPPALNRDIHPRGLRGVWEYQGPWANGIPLTNPPETKS